MHWLFLLSPNWRFLLVSEWLISPGSNITGTLGVLIKAKTEGYVEKIEPLIKLLIDDGLYIDQKTKELALEKAGEGGHYVRVEH